MAEILVMDNNDNRFNNDGEDGYFDDDNNVHTEENGDNEEEEEDTEYSDFSTMIPHISDSNSQMNPVWQVKYI